VRYGRLAIDRETTGDELPRTKGLREVVVGAEAKTGHAVVLGGLAVSMMIGTFEPVRSVRATSSPRQVRKPKVEHDEVRI